MPLPSFIIAGAPKCGTTTLVEWLRGHPRLFVPRPKLEPHYFAFRFDQGEAWYRSLFDAAGDRMACEKSTWYLADAEAPVRMKTLLPNAKLIFLLREPVARAVSHYWFRMQRGVVAPDCSFDKFLDAAPEMVETGHYAKHLARWESHFGADRMLTLLIDDLEEDRRSATMARVLDFVGLEPFEQLPIESESNKTVVRDPSRPAARLRRLWTPIYRGVARTPLARPMARAAGAARALLGDRPMTAQERRDSIPRESLRRLAAVYEPGIAPLEARLGRDLSAWRRPLD